MSAAEASSARGWLRGIATATWERVGVALLLLGAVVGFFVYPTYPNYDSIYSLLWGRELLGLDHLSFEAYRAPTEHPLAIAFGALLNPLGGSADRAMVAFSVLSFVVLVIAVYLLAKTAFTPLVGAVAAALVLTRFDFPFLAARGYIDISYLAVVMVAAVVEARAPRRRPVIVLVLLAAAGLMRPEAWVLAGLYWLWLLPQATTWALRVKYAMLAAVGPVVWVGVDFAVTGNWKYSLTATGELANELGRDKGIGEVPDALYTFLITLTKFPIFIAGIAGLLIAIALMPRRMIMPFVLFASGVGTFAAVGLAGLSVIDRYLLVASLALMIFAAVAIGGWTMLREGTLRKVWAGTGAIIVVIGIAFSVTRVDLGTFDTELRFRSDAHVALDKLLHDPAVGAALRCPGANLYVPNHKLIPDVRWIADRPQSGVIARSAVKKGEPVIAPQRGVVIVVHDRLAIGRQALVTSLDRPEQNLPPPSFDRIATSTYYAAYARC